MTTATYSLQVAWSGRLTGTFRIGTSTIGSANDLIGGDFDLTEPTIVADITSEVKAIRIRRGRQSDMQYMQQGTMTITLKDQAGKYNPENAGSVYAGYLVPMRPVQLIATYSGTDYPLYYGYIAEISHDPQKNVKESVIDCVDLFEWLQRYKPTIATQTSQTVGYLIGKILDSIYFVVPGMRNIESGGNTIGSWSADGTKTALTLIEELLEVDRGVFFIAADGKATYQTRTTLWRSYPVGVTFTEVEASGVKPSVSKDTILNGQTVTKTGGAAQTYTDATSRRKYGYREGDAIDSAYLESDTQAMSLARFIVSLNKDPRSPAKRLRLLNDNATNLTHILARDLMLRVGVNESVGGTNFEGHIQAIEHEIHSGGIIHEAYFTIQKQARTFFTIGRSSIGSSHKIGY